MIAWIGTGASILGSFLVALKVFFVGYVMFSIGSFAWLFIAYKRQDSALGVLNGIFFVANCIGLYNFF